MDNIVKPRRQLAMAGISAFVSLCFIANAGATEPCGLCNDEVVINSALATCFLDEYPDIAGKADGAVVVDLSHCEQARGVIEPLANPEGRQVEPDMQFMLTRPQLACLKSKLEQPGLVLDPSATIALDSCG